MICASVFRQLPFWFLSSRRQTLRRSSHRPSALKQSAWIVCELLEERILLSGAPLLRDVTVMSQNLYLGTDLEPIIAAISTGNPQTIVGAVSAGWQQVVASHFQERAGGLADQVLQNQPTLIGLQEAALWQTGLPGDPAPATHVEMDFLQIFVDELAERGLHYQAVTVSSNFSAEVPGYTNLTDPASLRDIRLTDRDVILARTDLPAADLKLSHAQAENFQTNLFVPLPALPEGGIEITRGWTSVDVKVRGKEFRMINTHLEEEQVAGLDVSGVQQAQAQELLTGPADTALPVLLVGDFNSRADQNEAVYEAMIGAGFQDVWTQTHPGDPGFTCCHDPDLPNGTEDFQDGRIDWVLYRGDFLPQDMQLYNVEPADKTASGVWLSDHAGLVASVIAHPLPPVVRRFAAQGGTLAIPLSRSTSHFSPSVQCEWAASVIGSNGPTSEGCAVGHRRDVPSSDLDFAWSRSSHDSVFEQLANGNDLDRLDSAWAGLRLGL